MHPPRTDELFQEVYAELRRLATAYLKSERPGITLQPTALVHEAYLQLSQRHGAPWQDRHQFFAIAAVAMRQVLVQQARRRNAAKRGGSSESLPRGDAEQASDALVWDYDELDQVLERLESDAPELCRVVELRYYVGLSVDETAATLQTSPRTVKRRWALARAYLNRELGLRNA
jgi:RNA polymerase sigma factor (TIGR02999 family)